MKVAVVTPYYRESDEQLDRCMSSVSSQTHVDVTHILVADGYPRHWRPRGTGFEHIIFPHSHGDAGATPRALGAMSAFSRGFDAVAFLDADNWYQRDHIESMVSAIRSAPEANMAIATRTIHGMDGKPLYVDRVESNGDNMVDTNCMFLMRSMSNLLIFWIAPREYRLVGDRVFWENCKAAGVRAVRCDQPTVAYVTRWAWHYHHAGVSIPDDAVWLEPDGNGGFKHVLNIDRRNQA